LGLIIAIATIVVVVGGNLRKVLKGGEVCLALSACSFSFFLHEPQHLRHAWLGWWGRIASSLATSSRSHSGEKGLGEKQQQCAEGTSCVIDT
jgi:hypothetical protein